MHHVRTAATGGNILFKVQANGVVVSGEDFHKEFRQSHIMSFNQCICKGNVR
jgi:hypothetical protein